MIQVKDQTIQVKMNKEFVRQVLGDEAASTVISLPKGGVSMLVTAEQIKLLESAFERQQIARYGKRNSKSSK
jgi:hypothetical protein